MAVVVDEYEHCRGHHHAGSILEELVGEIWDEATKRPRTSAGGPDGSWIVLGSAGVDDLYERLGLPEDEYRFQYGVERSEQEKSLPSAQGGRPVPR